MGNIVVVGIAGGTGSGKTTFAHALAHQLGGDVTVITHDNYYRAHNDLTYEQRTHLNYDHPDAFQTDLMVNHLSALKRGETVEVPVYDFTVHNRSQETMLAVPSRIILVEGILIFHWPELRDLMDIKVFVDADADVRILRRALRDMDERGRSLQSVIDQYLTTVKPMHQQYVEPTKQYANIIVPGTDKSQLAMHMLANHLRTLAYAAG